MFPNRDIVLLCTFILERIDYAGFYSFACKMVGPIIEELAEEYQDQVIMGKCDVDECENIPVQFGIRNIPTVLFFKNGEVVDKQVGSAAKSVFDAKIKALL